MAKAYWVTTYRNISNPDALAEYAKLAAPAIQAGGGRFLVRGTPSKVYEAGLNQRTVIIEFDSVASAVAAHDSDGYKAALKALGNAAERDIRIVEGAAERASTSSTGIEDAARAPKLGLRPRAGARLRRNGSNNLINRRRAERGA